MLDVERAASELKTLIPDGWLQRCANDSATGIVLGSGLGGLADVIEADEVVPFEKISGFAKSTAGGHRGQLIFGTLQSAPVIAMAGRLHRYEGWSTEQVSFPIRVMSALGIGRLIVSNAAGGVNPKLRVGDIVVIRDHINWLHARGDFAAREQAWFRGGGEIYSADLSRIALAAARAGVPSGGGFSAVEGTYLATLGPTYETRAEYRMMRQIGADVVGMSTVPEVLAARERGIPVLALSVVSNVADPDRPVVADHAEVLEAGDAAAAKLESIVRAVLVSPLPA